MSERKPLILVADDDQVLRTVVRGTHQMHGFECVEADTGRQALELARDARPDAIVLDMNMPNLNGLAVLHALTSQAGTREIPVLLLTASNDNDKVSAAARLGAKYYLVKPFTPTVLIARIRSMLSSASDVLSL